MSLKDEVATPTERPYDGVVDPIPTLPLDPMLKRLDPDDDATVKILERDPDVPTTESLEYGVEDPTPMFPPAKIVNIDTPEEDATLNGLIGDEVDDCTLKVKDEEDALIPRTEPLSIKVEVPRVFEVNQRVAHPKAPPVMVEAAMLSDDVDTQRVELPVDCRIIPKVPEAFVESRSVPMSERLVVEALVIRKSVEDPLLAKKFVVDALDAAKVLVTVALVAVTLPRVDTPVTLKAPERERLVPEALERTL